jgi:hypothetical protein
MGLFSRKRSLTEEEPEVEALDEVEPDPEDDEAEVVEAVAADEAEVIDDPPADTDDESTDDDTEAEADEGGEADEDAEADDDGEADEDAEADDDGEADEDAEADDDGETDEAEVADGGDDEDGELVDTGQVEFELGDWGARERQLLDGELAAARVRRAWEAGTLVVAASDADVVDDLIDYIEERIALDLSPDVEPVIYEVKDWPPGLEDRFLELLIENRIAHMRGYQEITIGVDDEERVDELVEQVTAAWEEEQPTEAEIDGPDAQDVLSELFVSSDRLLHDPSDRAATVRFDDAAESALGMGLPFGFDEAMWGTITDLVGALRDKLAEAESTDDDIVEAATALRTHLRPLV